MQELRAIGHMYILFSFRTAWSTKLAVRIQTSSQSREDLKGLTFKAGEASLAGKLSRDSLSITMRVRVYKANRNEGLR